MFRARFTHGHSRLEELLEAVMPRLDELGPDDVGALAKMASGAGYLAYHLADYPAAERHVGQARDVRARPGAPASRGDEHDVLGLVARRRCQYDRAGSCSPTPSDSASSEATSRVSRTG